MNKFIPVVFFQFIFLVQCFTTRAQERTMQYPAALSNSFIGVSIGYINYPFSTSQLEPGFHVEGIHVPHTAVRIVLFGHEFNKYLSAQITYMRPVEWVEYKNINNDGAGHTVWMNIAGVTLKTQTPAWKKLSVYGEAGFSLITRSGFEIAGEQVVKNANYGTIIAGAGMQYTLHDKWQLMLSTVYSPKDGKTKQPHTIFYSGGFRYSLRPLSPERLKAVKEAAYSFPKDLVQLGLTPASLGYGVNNFVSKGAVPIFWGGDVHVRKGISLNYQRNIFHTKKVFSLDWGVNLSYWQSRVNKNNFCTVSLFPLLRFTAIRSKTADIYFNYSVAGPTYISRIITDGTHTGRHFTFQDFMGMGVLMGAQKKLNAEIRIMHYSNGNLFPENAGYMIPLTFNVGYSF